MKKIHYLSPKSMGNYPNEIRQFQAHLENYFRCTKQTQNFELVLLGENTNLAEINYLIIPHPIRFFRQDNQKIHYSVVSPIWHRYLLKHSPKVKILLVGVTYLPEGTLNYINLLDPPNDFNTFLTEAQYVADFPFEMLEDGTYKDPWREKVRIYGTDAIDRTKIFLKGHERSQSENNLSKPLSDINMYFNILCWHLKEGRDWQTTVDRFLNDNTHRIWQRLQNHWKHHQRDLELTPFFAAVAAIEEQMGKIRDFMSIPIHTLNREKVLELHPDHYTQTIRTILDEAIAIYIYDKAFFNTLNPILCL
ncbi:MAG: hypothetical protein JNM36_13530 [Chitinophagales bacterium]|nr:hypothetical protein [Chitinophagales bacterium]